MTNLLLLVTLLWLSSSDGYSLYRMAIMCTHADSKAAFSYDLPNYLSSVLLHTRAAFRGFDVPLVLQPQLR